jgi:hypothetical protein
MGGDLVTAGAVLGEQAQAFGHAALLRRGLGDGWTGRERRDVLDKRPELAAREQHAPPPRLLGRRLERHVAGAQIEVGRLRADTAQRRPLPFDVAGAALAVRALARDPVAGGAVARIELRAELRVRQLVFVLGP